jgi:hypothetical protein
MNKKYLQYRNENISGNIIYENSLIRLNGNIKYSGRLFLTDEMLILVMIKGKYIVSEIKIPLSSIAAI